MYFLLHDHDHDRGYARFRQLHSGWIQRMRFEKKKMQIHFENGQKKNLIFKIKYREIDDSVLT